MNAEEDREALAQVIYRAWNEEDPGDDVPWINEAGRGKIADAILAAGFHRTTAPAPDVQALIDELRAEGKAWREEVGEMPLFDRAADALEAALGVSE